MWLVVTSENMNSQFFLHHLQFYRMISHDKNYLKCHGTNFPNIALQIVNMSFDCDTSESVTFKLEKFQVIIIGE